MLDTLNSIKKQTSNELSKRKKELSQKIGIKKNKVKSTFDSYNNKIKNKKDNFLNRFKDYANKFSSGEMAKLNKLMGFLKSFNLKGFLGSLKGKFESFLKNQLQKLKSLVSDALKSLENASLLAGINILEDLKAKVKSYLFIPDIVFSKTIAGMLVKVPGVDTPDIRFKDDYVRKQALTRDWNYTLEVIDNHIGFDYNITDPMTEASLSMMSTNGCYKNVDYAFAKLKKHHDILKHQYDVCTDESVKGMLLNDINRYKKLFVKTFRDLIVTSYDNYFANKCCKTLLEYYSEFIKPCYFGDNDDTYNKTYKINESDLNLMLPFFVKHKQTKIEKDMQDELQNKYINEIKEACNNNDVLATKHISNMAKKDVIVTGSFLKGTSKNVTDRLKKTNSSVKEQFDKKYVVPRNASIKQIYVLLSNRDVFGDDYMFNPEFHERCKYKTMSSARKHLDKAMGIGLVDVARPMGDLIEAHNAAIYNYTIKVSDYLFDPKKNMKSTVIHENTNGSINGDISIGDLTYPKQKNENPGETGINQELYNKINDMLKKTSLFEENQKITSITRHLDKLFVHTKKEIIIKYFIWLYDVLKVKGMPEDKRNLYFSQLVLLLFNKKNIFNPKQLEKFLQVATSNSVSVNIRTLLSIEKLDLFDRFIAIDNEDHKEIVKNIFYITALFIAYESYVKSYIQCLFLFDHEQLSSILKQTFIAYKKYINKLRISSHTFFKMFYKLKDHLTLSFDGFDIGGILYYDSINKNIEYSNCPIGDFTFMKKVDKTLFVGCDIDDTKSLKTIDRNTFIIKDHDNRSIEIISSKQFHGETFYYDTNNSVYTFVKNDFVKIVDDITEWEMIFVPHRNEIYFGSRLNSGLLAYDKRSKTVYKTGFNNGGLYHIDCIMNYTLIYSEKGNIGVWNSPEIRKHGATQLIHNGNYTSSWCYTESSRRESRSEDDPEDTSSSASYHYYWVTTNFNHIAFGSADDKGIVIYNTHNPTTTISSPITSGKHIICNFKGHILSFSDKVYELANPYTVSYEYNYSGTITYGRAFRIVSNDFNSIGTINATYAHVYKDFIHGIKTDSSNANKMFIMTKNLNIKDLDITEEIKTPAEFIWADNNNTFWLTIKNSIYTYNSDSFEFKKLINSDTGVRTYETIDNVFFNTKDKGISYVKRTDMSVCHETNIKIGYYNILETDSKYICISREGTNKGFMLSDKETISFDYTENCLKTDDFNACEVIDNILYLGINRKQYEYKDIENVPYNIDKYIFGLPGRIVYNKNISFIEEMFDIFVDVLKKNEELLNYSNVKISISEFFDSLELIEQEATNGDLIPNTVVSTDDFDIEDKDKINSIVSSIILSSTNNPDIIARLRAMMVTHIVVRDTYDTEDPNFDMSKLDHMSDAYLNQIE